MKPKIGLLDLLFGTTIILLVLRLAGVITWPWYWLISPLAVYVAVIIIISLPFTIIDLIRRR